MFTHGKEWPNFAILLARAPLYWDRFGLKLTKSTKISACVCVWERDSYFNLGDSWLEKKMKSMEFYLGIHMLEMELKMYERNVRILRHQFLSFTWEKRVCYGFCKPYTLFILFMWKQFGSSLISIKFKNYDKDF